MGFLHCSHPRSSLSLSPSMSMWSSMANETSSFFGSWGYPKSFSIFARRGSKQFRSLGEASNTGMRKAAGGFGNVRIFFGGGFEHGNAQSGWRFRQCANLLGGRIRPSERVELRLRFNLLWILLHWVVILP